HRLLQQLLAGLVAFQDHDRPHLHGGGRLASRRRREGAPDMSARIGWYRRGSKGRFYYVDDTGVRLADEAQLERVRSLAIPPAWRDVWVARSARSKLQATGLDAAGRKQYLYHPEFRARQEQAKYDKLIRFAERLPALRATM